jgi:hypothetical protein
MEDDGKVGGMSPDAEVFDSKERSRIGQAFESVGMLL